MRRLLNLALLLVARAGADGELLSDAYTLLADDFVKTYDYGNVGQDLIKRFRTMTLDFVSMNVAFE